MAEEMNIRQTGGTGNRKARMNFGRRDIETTIDKDGRVLSEKVLQMPTASAMVMLKASQLIAKPPDVKVHGKDKYHCRSKNIRSINHRTMCQVHVTASQQPQTYGLPKLMNAMTACITIQC